MPKADIVEALHPRQVIPVIDTPAKPIVAFMTAIRILQIFNGMSTIERIRLQPT